MKSARIIAFLVAVLVTPVSSLAADAPGAAQTAFDALMNSIATKNYDKFVAAGSTAFKQDMNKQMFDQVVAQVSGPLSKGYTVEYLAELNQHGYKAYVWKISYDSSPENTLAKLVLEDGSVVGFWLQ